MPTAPLGLSSDSPELLRQPESLVSRLGLVSSVREAPPPRGLSRVACYSASIGSGRPGRNAAAKHGRRVTASGMAVDDPGRARLVAIVEAAERYAGLNQSPCVFITATAEELSGRVLDFSRIPRCSPRELAGNCSLSTPNPTAPMRWVSALELVSGEETWIPAVMACYGLDSLLESERFWYQISTGNASHFDPTEALVRALCEVVERDLIAVTWLQMLSLPLVDCPLPETVQYLLDWSSLHFIDSYLFDGTSDIGVPTVYCLHVVKHSDRVRQVVGCGTGRTIPMAAEKALLEALMCGIAFESAYDSDENVPPPCEFVKIIDSGRYMARPEYAAAFDFLVNGDRKSAASADHVLPDDASECLTQLVGSLRSSGMQAFVSDRTTSELASVGLTSVCAVIPDLQPMTLLPDAQYRAHPRLYSAPKIMGHRVCEEEELNSWPMPFA
jgi:ribosomal protein S12 methylthiotransferase accessory factor